jgi:hypothetical protein
MSQQLASYHLRSFARLGSSLPRWRDDLVSLTGKLELAARQAEGERVPEPSPA